jgi:hypothetical protein
MYRRVYAFIGNVLIASSLETLIEVHACMHGHYHIVL